MTSVQERTLVIGLAEMKATSDLSAVLTCLGLGSCIALSAHDPVAKVSGMAHIVLPSSNGEATELSPKYADTAVPLLLQEMEKLGALKGRLRIKIAGGAQMSVSVGAGSLFKTGERNIEAVKAALKDAGLRLVASNIGGNIGRTVRLYASSGKTTVSTAGTGTVEL